MFCWVGIMHRGNLCRARKSLLQAVALFLLCALALPARPADDRAVKTRAAVVYPEIAKRMRIAGEVKLEVTVDAQGNVKDVREISGNRVLGMAAEDAVRKYKFESGSGDATVILAVNFVLPE